jgi:hypothetical protein
MTDRGHSPLHASLTAKEATERVSVEFGLRRTLSDLFQVLGYELPQHLPHLMFSSVNSTEGANRLRQNDSGKSIYPNITTHPQDATSRPPAKQPTASAIEADARPESPRPGAVEGGAGRERRGRNLRPLPQPMDGSNTAIVRVFQEGTGIEREQGQGLFTKKSLACSTPPGTCFPSLMTTCQRY